MVIIKSMFTQTKVFKNAEAWTTVVGSVIVVCMLLLPAVIFGKVARAHSDEPDGMMAPAGVTEVKPAPGETHHLEVKAETLEGYRIPGMKITVTATPQGGGTPIEKELDGMFGGNFHYGAGMAFEPKQYLLVFHLDPPTFMREGKRANQWLESIDAEFVFDAAAPLGTSGIIGSKETADMKISFEAEEAESMFMLSEDADGHMEPVHDQQQAPAQGSSSLSLSLIGALGLIIGFILGRFIFKTRLP